MTNMLSHSNGRLGMPSLLGWEPLRLFDDLFNWNPFGGQVVWNTMPVQVRSDDDHVFVTADLPGVDAGDVDITYDHGALAIAAKRGERAYRFTVLVGDDIDPDAIEADLDKGVLTVKAGKRPEAKPRKIALRGADTPKRLDRGESQ